MLGKLSPVSTALLVSLGLHAALLTVRFVDPAGFERIFKDTPLDVILVNSRSGEAPEKRLTRTRPPSTLACNRSACEVS